MWNETFYRWGVGICDNALMGYFVCRCITLISYREPLFLGSSVMLYYSLIGKVFWFPTLSFSLSNLTGGSGDITAGGCLESRNCHMSLYENIFFRSSNSDTQTVKDYVRTAR